MASKLVMEQLNDAGLESALQDLKRAILELNREVVMGVGNNAATMKMRPKSETRAVIREKARTGALKPLKMSGTGPVVKAQTAKIPAQSPIQGGDADPEWVSLAELAAQNQATPDRRGQENGSNR